MGAVYHGEEKAQEDLVPLLKYLTGECKDNKQ